jgi:hypothetical protein
MLGGPHFSIFSTSLISWVPPNAKVGFAGASGHAIFQILSDIINIIWYVDCQYETQAIDERSD